jgi:hypothetical protein
LKVGTPVRIRATYNAVTYTLFRGHVEAWPISYDSSGNDSVVSVPCVENLSLLNTTRLSAAAYSEESSEVRIGNLLDDAGWPAAARDLDLGATVIAAVTDFSGSVLELIDQAVEAEQGEFFVAKNGDATFLGRVAFSTASSQGTFDPGTNLDYATVAVAYDNDYLINYAEVTGFDEIPQTASDSTSITDHGEHSFVLSNESIPTEAFSLNVAEWIVGKNKDVAVRVTGFTIKPPPASSTLWPEVLDRELRDLVTVKVNPPGSGTTLNQLVGVEAISHDVTPGFWQTTYTCHPVSAFEVQDYWILGTSDDLDTDTILA